MGKFSLLKEKLKKKNHIFHKFKKTTANIASVLHSLDKT
jgi:hypothetical protein